MRDLESRNSMVTSWHEGEQGRRPGWIHCQEGAGDGQWVSNKRREKEEGVCGGGGESVSVAYKTTAGQRIGCWARKNKRHFLSLLCGIHHVDTCL